MKAIRVSAAFLLVTASAAGMFGLSAHAAELVNINTASIEELDALPGVGPVTAQHIIDARPYSTIQEISRANGIGEPGSKSYEDIIGLITVGGGQAQAQESAAETAGEEKTAAPASDSGGSSASRPKPPSSIHVAIYAPRYAVAGAEVQFEAQAADNGKNLSGAKFEWSFGDGASVRGASAEHTYAYPGTYVVQVAAAQGGVEGSERHIIEVLPFLLALVSEEDGSLSVANASKQETDLGYWSIVSGNERFVFPAGTVVLPGATLRLAPPVTGIHSARAAILLFPDGALAARAQTRGALEASAAPGHSPASAQQAPGALSSPAASLPSAPLETQPASVAAAGAFALPPGWAYGLGLAALVLLGAGAVLYLQEGGTELAGPSAADEYKITGI